MPKIEVAESKALPPGHYAGVMTRTALRDVSFVDNRGVEKHAQYLDLHIVPDDEPDMTMRPSFPWNLTERSALFSLLLRFGATKKKLRVGQSLDTDKFLAEGTRVTFAVTTDKNGFSVVVKDTIAPVDEDEDEDPDDD
jgi:hypothetical protein